MQITPNEPISLRICERFGDPGVYWTICNECSEGLGERKRETLSLNVGAPKEQRDPDPFDGRRTVRLTMGHIIDKSKGGDDSAQNLRAVCTNCNEGLQNASLPKPDRIHLLSQIRRATLTDQKAVLDWLLQKFGLKIEVPEGE